MDAPQDTRVFDPTKVPGYQPGSLAPTTQPSPTGISDTSFLGLMNNLNTSFQQTNGLVDQKNAILHAAMGNALDSATMQKLPPDMQALIQSGNRDALLMQAQSLNDQINNNSSSVASSISYLTTGYQNAVKTANDQKQAEMDNLIKIAQTFVGADGKVDIRRAGAAFQSLYPGVDMSGIINSLQGLMPVSEYNKYIYQGSGPPGSLASMTGGLADPVSAAMQAIVGNESKGNYQAISLPIVGGPYKGQHSYGKYQVLESNIGPWTAAVTGTAMTPQQFLADPATQDAVAKQQIGDLWKKYGNIQDVASMWFTNLPADKSKGYVDKTTGMTAEQYIKNATNAFNNQQSAAASASDPTVQSYVQGLASGVVTSLNGVPSRYRNAVVNAAAAQGIQTPQGERRQILAAQAAVKNYIDLPQYQLVANSFPFLSKIDAAEQIPGSVPDQELLDSYTKLSTQGNVITDAQISIILKGQSWADSADVMLKKLQSGGVLSDAQRKQISDIGHAVFNNLKAGYQPIYDKASSNLQQGGFPTWVQSAVLPDLNALFTQSQAAIDQNKTPSGGGGTGGSSASDLRSKYGY